MTVPADRDASRRVRAPVTRSRRRAVQGVALVTLALASCALAWFVSTALRQVGDVRARVEAASLSGSQDARGWAPADSFSFDLDPPRSAMSVWADAMHGARDERVPPPPAELVAWLDEHAPEVDDLVDRVRATGPLDLPAFDYPAINSANRRHPFVAAVYAKRLLVTSAGVAAFAGRLEIADERLDAAWTLHVSISRANTIAATEDLLGALRTVRVATPREWLERLEVVDQREASSAFLVTQARRTVWEVEYLADSGVPAWLPGRLRRIAVRAAELPQACVQYPSAVAALDARDALLEQPRCEDPAALVAPVRPAPSTKLGLLGWLPARRRARVGNHLEEASRRIGDLNLTCHVLALRAGIADYQAPCDSPRFHVEPTAYGQLMVVADKADAGAVVSFTVAPP